MNPIKLLALSLSVASVALPPKAEAQCRPGTLFCASVHIGGAVAVAPPRPQVVYIQPGPPPPPVVYVQPVAPPPPAVVYVQPAPQPRPVVVVQQAANPIPAPAPVEPSGLGLHGSLGGTFSSRVHMGGLTGALRLRKPQGHLGVDLGLGLYAGTDYNGDERVEIPFTADALFFLNPRDTLQVYGLAGLGLSVATSRGDDGEMGFYEERQYAHVGGELGVGVELRLSPSLALNADVRAFLRQRVDEDAQPEFVDPADPSRRTNTSAGALANLGATIYF